MDAVLVGLLCDERKRLLADANRARNRGRHRTAIALYKRILLEEPHNQHVALRLAPLLAARCETFEAWQLFRAAARALLRDGRHEECLVALREACRALPLEHDAWRFRADLELKLGRDQVAYETLLEGRQHFRSPGTRAQAIGLLRRARAIEPWDPEVCLDLARLYARTDLGTATRDLLGSLSHQTHGWSRCRVLFLHWRLTLSFRDLWTWLRAVAQELRGADPESGPRFGETPWA